MKTEFSAIIRNMREHLSLSTTELSYLLGISQSATVRLEQSEMRGAITLASLKRVAAVLDCELRYEFVPSKTSSRKSKRQFGRKRVTGNFLRLNKSEVNRQLRSDEVKINGQLSRKARVHRACELSDVSYKIRKCSKMH